METFEDWVENVEYSELRRLNRMRHF